MMNFKMSNGVEIPAVGLGTFLMKPEEAQLAVKNALQNGYRMIDTAQAYMNERAVGRGIKDSGVDRKEIFLVTKLWASQYEVEGTVEKSLELLDTDYIDLLYIHQPSGNFMAGYRKLEEAYKKGIVKSIGISNFKGEKLARLLAECEIKPHFLQYEVHPYFVANDVYDICQENDIRIMSWYPLGHGDANLLNEEIFTTLAKKYNKTSAQIILRWQVQKGFTVIPGSKNVEHMKDNMNIFDFELTDEEMAQIAKLNKNVRYYVADDTKVESYASMNINLDSQK